MSIEDARLKLTARQLAKHWDADGTAQDCVRNIVCHLDVLLTDADKREINWHDEQSVSLAVMRALSLLNDRADSLKDAVDDLWATAGDMARYKHAYETCYRDDCHCPVNDRHEITPGCPAHTAK